MIIYNLIFLCIITLVITFYSAEMFLKDKKIPFLISVILLGMGNISIIFQVLILLKIV